MSWAQGFVIDGSELDGSPFLAFKVVRFRLGAFGENKCGVRSRCCQHSLHTTVTSFREHLGSLAHTCGLHKNGTLNNLGVYGFTKDNSANSHESFRVTQASHVGDILVSKCNPRPSRSTVA